MTSNDDKILNLISLAKKAGVVVYGHETCKTSITKDKISFLIITNDAAYNTKKKFVNMCEYRNIKYMIFDNSDKLERILGRNNIKVIGITDANFASEISKVGRCK